MDIPEKFYQEQVKSLEKIIFQLNQRIKTLALLRLVCACIVCILIYFLFNSKSIYIWISLFIDICIFIFLVKKSSSFKDKKLFKEQLLKINRDELKALQHDFTAFDNGNEFIDSTHSYTYDLDVFGENSLFQIINRCGNYLGKNKLALHLSTPDISTENIQSIQEASKELKHKPEWRQQYQATGELAKCSKNDVEQIQSWLDFKNELSESKFYKNIIYIIPVITCAAWLLYIFNIIVVGFPICLSLLQLTITLSTVAYINQRQHIISERILILKRMFALIQLIEQENFHSTKIKTFKEKIFSKEKDDSKTFSRLINAVNALDNRLNILLAIILNALFLWDIRFMLRIEKHTDKFRTVFPQWLIIIAEIDILSSIACFAYNNPEYCVPELSTSEDFFLRTDQMGHPFIPKTEIIKNDFEHAATLNLYLITGANMSGKSTFLRTVGINILLANAGACVCADNFIYTPAKLYTSMRVTDSLNNHTSYFFAELNRIKSILLSIDNNSKSYILLDEILKGTNYNDQHSGSVKLIERILQLNGKGMIATHDIELTKLSDIHPKKIQNLAFDIQIENENMIFNYKYKEGVVETMNATLLMKQMNIL